jgi:hypothetical protein
MKNKPTKFYGLLAKFDNTEILVDAAKKVVQAGYRRFDAYTPYPVEELNLAMQLKPSLIPYLILVFGILGGLVGFFMQTYATGVDLPLNIGGRPLFSWPAYIPISFELIILFAALAGVFGLFVITRFPQPYHPLFNSEDFVEHGSSDSFYLDIEASDPNFDLERTRQFLNDLGAIQVNEIEA